MVTVEQVLDDIEAILDLAVDDDETEPTLARIGGYCLGIRSAMQAETPAVKKAASAKTAAKK